MFDTTHTSPYIYIRIYYQFHISIHMQYSKQKQNIPNEENTSTHDYIYNPKMQQQKISNK